MTGALVLRRTIEVHRALGDIPHAVGGALALAYHVRNPRATLDIDLNVSVVSAEAESVLERLPDGVLIGESDRQAIARDAQVRLWWPTDEAFRMPLDLFFAEHEFHYLVSQRALWVPMLDTQVPILTAADLTVFKVLFDRSKDWVDIEEIIAEDPPSWDLEEAARWLTQIIGPEDTRIARLRELAER